MRQPLLGAMIALLAGCASSPARQVKVPAAEWEAVPGLEATLLRADEELVLAMGATPDCNRACLLLSHVCLLAERICSIAGKYPEDEEAAARCRDAKARCRRARTRVTERCRCFDQPASDALPEAGR